MDETKMIFWLSAMKIMNDCLALELEVQGAVKSALIDRSGKHLRSQPEPGPLVYLHRPHPASHPTPVSVVRRRRLPAFGLQLSLFSLPNFFPGELKEGGQR